MSEAAPDLHVGPTPDQATVEPDAPAPEQPAVSTPDAPSEVPASASVEAVATSDAPAPDVDPLTVLKADIDRLTAEKDTLQSNHDRMYAEVNTLQRDLDAARAELATERAVRSPLAYQQQITDMRLQIARLEEENTKLRTQQPTPAGFGPMVVGLSVQALSDVKAAFLEALAEHAVPQVAPEADTAPPSSPFINRQ